MAAIFVAACAPSTPKIYEPEPLISLPNETVEAVRIPAQTVMRPQIVLVEPARRLERVVPTVTKTETRQIEVSPARTIEVRRSDGTVETRTIPPQYRTVTERVVVQPAQVEYVEVPAVYETVEVPTVEPVNPFTWDLDPGNTLAYFDPPPTEIKEEVDSRFFDRMVDGRVENSNLRQVFEKISDVLRSNSELAYEYRVFKYPKGFALMTNPERINIDGAIHTNSSGKRIDLQRKNARNFSEYVSAFFRVPENRIRFIAFIVTSERNIQDGSTEASEEVLEAIFESGDTRGALPLEILEKFEFDSSYRVQVRVYEFPTLPQVILQDGSSATSDSPIIREGHMSALASYDPSKFSPINFSSHKDGSFALQALFDPAQ